MEERMTPASSSIDQLAARPLPAPPVRLDEATAAALLAQLPSQWHLTGEVLGRAFELPDYASGVRLVVAIGRLAEAMNHHPDLHLQWGRVTLSVSTHDVDGLSELDFILAARIETEAVAELPRAARPPT
jgi:4a-hydroxytetrahydrobiopterin dehydratase